MNEMTEKELENYESTFATEGWKQLDKEMSEQIDAAKENLTSAIEARDIYFAQGFIYALRTLKASPATAEIRRQLMETGE